MGDECRTQHAEQILQDRFRISVPGRLIKESDMQDVVLFHELGAGMDAIQSSWCTDTLAGAIPSEGIARYRCRSHRYGRMLV